MAVPGMEHATDRLDGISFLVEERSGRRRRWTAVHGLAAQKGRNLPYRGIRRLQCWFVTAVSLVALVGYIVVLGLLRYSIMYTCEI